jgi:hypothetical protein
MTWIAPDVTRVDEPLTGDERATLEGLLDWHRATLLWKCSGLTGEQLAHCAVPPSNLSLLGLIRHVADAERAWFRRRAGGQPVPEVYHREDRPDAAFAATSGRRPGRMSLAEAARFEDWPLSRISFVVA